MDKGHYSLTEMSQLLGISKKTLSKYYSTPTDPPKRVFHGDECIYIGFSANLYERFWQHQTTIDSSREVNNIVMNII